MKLPNTLDTISEVEVLSASDFLDVLSEISGLAGLSVVGLLVGLFQSLPWYSAGNQSRGHEHRLWQPGGVFCSACFLVWLCLVDADSQQISFRPADGGRGPKHTELDSPAHKHVLLLPCLQ